MQKISFLRIGLLTVCSAVLLTSCSTYQNLATQWKYKDEYKNPGTSASSIKVKSSKNYTPSIDVKEAVTNESTLINVYASTKNSSELLVKMPETLTTKKVISSAEASKATSKEVRIAQKQIKSELKVSVKEIKAEAKNEGAKADGGKSQIVAFLLAFLIGIFGIHRFYLGGKKNTTNGILQLIFTLLIITAPITWIWVTVDWIRILVGTLKPGSGEYATKL